jgi:hypothetical protein
MFVRNKSLRYFVFYRSGLVWIGSHRWGDRFPGAPEARRRSLFVVRRTAGGTAPRTAHSLKQSHSPMSIFVKNMFTLLLATNFFSLVKLFSNRQVG